MAAQYSFVMKGMTKSFPGAPKPILNNIHLQFYPDAKIAIIGPNGSGKSTLMKIMAGRDTEFQGEAWPGEGIRVGYLEQEPHLDPLRLGVDKSGDGEEGKGGGGEEVLHLRALRGAGRVCQSRRRALGSPRTPSRTKA